MKLLKRIFHYFFDRTYDCFNQNVDDYDAWSECDIYNKICAICETCLFYKPKERRI